MGYDIDRSHHARAGRYTAGGNSRRYVVVHYTANTAPAENEAKNLANNFFLSSFHYVLDDTSIFQCLDESDTAYAVGAWVGAKQLIGNNESISIEVCNDGWEFSTAQMARLRWLVQDIMARNGIPADHVVRHRDCHTGRKECPLWYVDDDRWRALHRYITTPEAGYAPEIGDMDMGWFAVDPGDGATYVYEPGVGFHPCASEAELKSVQRLHKLVTGEEIPGVKISNPDFKRITELMRRTV